MPCFSYFYLQLFKQHQDIVNFQGKSKNFSVIDDFA